MNMIVQGEEKFDDIVALMDSARRACALMKALSHEGRLLILCTLSEGEKSVTELERRMMIPQASVSQHLARLRNDHLVKARRDGRMIYYSIATPEVTRIIETLCAIYRPKKDR